MKNLENHFFDFLAAFFAFLRLVSQPLFAASDLAETLNFFLDVGFLAEDFFLVTIFAV